MPLRYDRAVPALTRDRILATAVSIADRDGFEAVTLRRIATELGVHVTSLYNHVPTRDAVTDGIVERLIDEAKLPLTPVGWEEWVRTFFWAIGSMAATHPGAFTALQRRPVQGAQAAASFEIALAAFSEAGLSPEETYSAVKATSLMVLSVGLERAMAVQRLLPETVLEDLPVEQFPHIRRAAAISDPEAAWSFSLEVLVAGLQTQIGQQRARRTE